MQHRITVRSAFIRINSSWVRRCLIGLVLCLPCTSFAASNIDVCQEPAAESHLSIGYFNYETNLLERNLGTSDRENFSTDLLFHLNSNWFLGGGHRSEILNVDGLELQTNGYLHTFFFPVYWVNRSAEKSFQFSIAPALSASSNVTGDPGEYTADALQVLGSVVWGRQMSDRLGLRYGVCGDHRFGGYRVYPLISANWQPHPDWRIELGFPSSEISYRITERLTSSLRIAPNGNEWYVKDKSLQQHSQLAHEAYVLEWRFNWRAHEHFMLTANVGREFRSSYELTLQDESSVRLSSDPATRIGVALAWIF
jgi:hypothetical protein